MCSSTLALTEALPPPSPNRHTHSTVAPSLASSFSTLILSFLATLYCLPPVLIIANILRIHFCCLRKDGKYTQPHHSVKEWNLYKDPLLCFQAGTPIYSATQSNGWVVTKKGDYKC